MTRPSKIERADLAVTQAAGKGRKTRMVKTLGALSEIADQPQLIGLCAATLALGLFSGNRRLAEAGGRMLAAELLATKLKSLIKHRVDRTRPHVVANGGRYKLKRGQARDSALNSFPSGHTAGAVAVASAVARVYPEHKATAFTAAGAIALVQIPRSKHYPTDLAAGALIGFVAETTIDLLLTPRN